ncbi:glycosyltransferase family protein [Frankia sp. AgKG'84/4]|uniref:hypothetical protein n=1 Tax=Frankia sp. AgKG'84/4 TaxID=573490 RepID=UPI0035AED450
MDDEDPHPTPGGRSVAVATPTEAEPSTGVRAGWSRLPESVRATLPLWLGSRIAVALLSLAAARALTPGSARDAPGLRTLWDRWDVGLFTKVARYGYLSPAYADRTEVDFPGLPLAIRLVHLFVRDWIAAGLIVSLLAGVVTAAALWRLAADEVGERAARFAVVSLICFPYAVFLFAAYSEGVFLAFASASWLAARRDRWWLAGLLGAGAASARISGVAFGVALAVQYVVSRRAAGRPVFAWPALSLALVPMPVVAYLGYLRVRTGGWGSYTDAMRVGWHREVDWPWSGWSATWSAALDGDGQSAFVWFWRGELLAVVVGVALTIALLAGRRWGEATFLGVMTAIMGCTNYYASGIRGILVAFPLYLMLARLAARRPWVASTYLCVCGPVMVAFVVAFTQGKWVD